MQLQRQLMGGGVKDKRRVYRSTSDKDSKPGHEAMYHTRSINSWKVVRGSNSMCAINVFISRWNQEQASSYLHQHSTEREVDIYYSQYSQRTMYTCNLAAYRAQASARCRGGLKRALDVTFCI